MHTIVSYRIVTTVAQMKQLLVAFFVNNRRITISSNKFVELLSVLRLSDASSLMSVEMTFVRRRCSILMYTVSQKANFGKLYSFDKHGLILMILSRQHQHQHTFRNCVYSTVIAPSPLLTLFAFNKPLEAAPH